MRSFKNSIVLALVLAMVISLLNVNPVAISAAPTSLEDELAEFMSLLSETQNGSAMARTFSLEDDTEFFDGSDIIHVPQKPLDLTKIAKSPKIMPFGLPQQQVAYKLNDTRGFYLNNESAKVTSKVIGTSKNTNVWIVDDAAYHAYLGNVHTDDCTIPAVTAKGADIAETLQGIYDRMTNTATGFGPHSYHNDDFGGEYFEHGDIDQDTKINVLLYDIYDDGNNRGGFVAGYFWAVDYFGYGHIYNGVHGSQMDMFHMDIGKNQGYRLMQDDINAFYNTLAHEFQHMLFYSNADIYTDVSTDNSWINESLSEYAGTFYTKANTKLIDRSRLRTAASWEYEELGASGPGDFFTFNNSFKSYGMANLFGLYGNNVVGASYPTNIYKVFASSYFNLADMRENIGLALKNSLGSAFSSYTPLKMFELYYHSFMREFAADGGGSSNQAVLAKKFVPGSKDLRDSLWSYDRKPMEEINLNETKTISLPSAGREKFYQLPESLVGQLEIKIQKQAGRSTLFYYVTPDRDVTNGATVVALNNQVNTVTKQDGFSYIYAVTYDSDDTDSTITLNVSGATEPGVHISVANGTGGKVKVDYAEPDGSGGYAPPTNLHTGVTDIYSITSASGISQGGRLILTAIPNSGMSFQSSSGFYSNGLTYLRGEFDDKNYIQEYTVNNLSSTSNIIFEFADESIQSVTSMEVNFGEVNPVGVGTVKAYVTPFNTSAATPTQISTGYIADSNDTLTFEGTSSDPAYRLTYFESVPPVGTANPVGFRFVADTTSASKWHVYNFRGVTPGTKVVAHFAKNTDEDDSTKPNAKPIPSSPSTSDSGSTPDYDDLPSYTVDVDGLSIPYTIDDSGNATLTVQEYILALLLEKLRNNGGTEIVMDLSKSKPLSFDIYFPTSWYSENGKQDIKVITSFGTACIPQSALSEQRTQSFTKVVWHLEKGSFKIGLKVDGTVVNSISKQSPIKLILPYEASGDKTATVIAYNKDTNKAVAQSNYNNKNVTLLTSEMGTYDVKNNSVGFSDMSGHWAAEAASYSKARNLIAGVTPDQFGPEETMTRGMFVSILGRLYGVEKPKVSKRFSDVELGQYYAGYVDWAAENHIIVGDGNGKFSPDRPVNREEVAIIFSKFAECIGLDLSGGKTVKYADDSDISDGTKDAVYNMQSSNLMGSKLMNRFEPKSVVTRADVAAVYKRFVQLMVR